MRCCIPVHFAATGAVMDVCMVVGVCMVVDHDILKCEALPQSHNKPVQPDTCVCRSLSLLRGLL